MDGEERWPKPSNMRRPMSMGTLSNALQPGQPSLCAHLENLAKPRSNALTQQRWEPPRMKTIVTTRTPNLQNPRAHHPQKATVKIHSHLTLRQVPFFVFLFHSDTCSNLHAGCRDPTIQDDPCCGTRCFQKVHMFKANSSF